MNRRIMYFGLIGVAMSILLIVTSESMMLLASQNGGGITYDSSGNVIGQKNHMYTWKLISHVSWISLMVSATIAATGFLFRNK
jgi:hypothetical protein